MNVLNFLRRKREPKVVSSTVIDGDGFVTSNFKYPCKIMILVYDDGCVKKRILEKSNFSENDEHFFCDKEVLLWDYMCVSSVLTEAIKRCGIDEYSYNYDTEIMACARQIVCELRAHNVRFIYSDGEEVDFRHDYKMKEVQFLYYAKFLNAENTL